MVWDIGEYQMLGGQPLEAWKQGTDASCVFRGQENEGRMDPHPHPPAGRQEPVVAPKIGEGGREDHGRKQDDESALSGNVPWPRSPRRQGQGVAEQPNEAVRTDSRRRRTTAEATEKDETLEPKTAVKPTPDATQTRGKRLCSTAFVEPMKCLPVKKIPGRRRVDLRAEVRRLPLPGHNPRGRGLTGVTQQEIVQCALP